MAKSLGGNVLFEAATSNGAWGVGQILVEEYLSTT